MSIKKPIHLNQGPPPVVMEALQTRLTASELQALEASFLLRAVSRQVDNAFAECMADSVGSVARFQIMMGLLATKGKGMSHKDIGTAMGVTRATVSGLMSSLERDGVVQSAEDSEDRRKQIARLTPGGEALINRAFEVNLSQMLSLFSDLSTEELSSLIELLGKVRAKNAKI